MLLLIVCLLRSFLARLVQIWYLLRENLEGTMNISTSMIDMAETETVASIMDVTEDQYSGSATGSIEIYDLDGNITGYTNSTTYTQTDGYSYVVTESFDANGILTQSVTSDSSPTQYLISYDSDGNVTGYVNITNYMGDDGIY